ncbi:DNA-3-methyladenine glycosylase family protein [Pontibacillus litoralis]|uniref:DNA-3-methyladenine glycosylase II n=1 Tax=Pontibacillus litoralis JSM 072002 TaxID=1385512 RepID=A0A0A5G800_9BACI|nr:DNA-3-methyladenine glycosylase [Pontibacillus litoralis]KGX88159.1 DNA-3-methyladenine glycosylase [Pontibacillus litoralis JSM 072002]
MWKYEVAGISMYDFDYALARYRMDPLSKLSQEERWIDVPVRLKNEKYVVRVQAIGSTKEPKFCLSSKSTKQREALIEHIEQLFQWQCDLRAIDAHFQATNLSALFQTYPGSPIVRDFHLYDSLMKIIIHQQLNMKFAYILSTRFVQQYGSNIQGVWFYPTPDEVATIPYEALRELQFSQRKAEYIIDTSRLIAEGKLNLERLSQQQDEEIMKEMKQIRGIGSWTVENWLMFGLGRENHLPKADIGIQNALKRYFHKEKKPSHEEIEQLCKGWEPYQSYASLTLWRSMEG